MPDSKPFICPLCANGMLDCGNIYKCICGFIFNKSICGNTFKPKDLQDLAQLGKTKPYPMLSKDGVSLFMAGLKLDKDAKRCKLYYPEATDKIKKQML